MDQLLTEKKMNGFWKCANQIAGILRDETVDISHLVDNLWAVLSSGEKSLWHVLDFSPLDQAMDEISVRCLTAWQSY